MRHRTWNIILPSVAGMCLIASAVVTPAALSQTAPSTAAPSASTAATATTVAADLSVWLDSKKAKVGNAVAFKTTQTVTVGQGVEIKKGSKLVGTITGVEAFQKGKVPAAIVVTIDHAEVGGQKIPLLAKIRTVTMSDQAAGDFVAASAPGASARMQAGSAGSGANGQSHAADMRGNPLDQSNSNVDIYSFTVVHPANPADSTTFGTGIPGMVLISSPHGSESGILASKVANIQLDPGTHMTLVIAAR